MSHRQDVAVVGAGLSGLLLAIQLLRRCAVTRVHLIDRASEFGRGLAYGADDPGHLLNVRAANMSAFPEDPDHFLTWLRVSAPPEATAQTFVSRQLYGTYLQSLLRAVVETGSGAHRLIVVPDEAVGLFEGPGRLRLRLALGRTLEVDRVVLAMGNPPPRELPGICETLRHSPAFVANPWAKDAFAGVRATDDILLVGSGLTAVDVVLGLQRRGHRGRIRILSRRGLKPRGHTPEGPAPASLDIGPRPRLSDLVRLVRRQAAATGWREAADGVRPHVQRLWREASADERGRFLRHLRPWWDVHRHRLSPVVASRIAAMEAAGQVRFVAGKIVETRRELGHVDVVWRPRGQASAETLRVDRIVNCTGPSLDMRQVESPLLGDLLARGFVRPDAGGLGLDVDPTCRLLDRDGVPSDRLLAVGPMSRAAFWEITAVPDIRIQVRDLAARLARLPEPAASGAARRAG